MEEFTPILIRCVVIQEGTVTGRFSYSNPNLQQIPARNKDIGPLIRSIFVPDEGCKWGSFDYSQQEPRVLVHFAALTGGGLKGADEVIESYKTEDPDFHQAVADMAGIDRRTAKTINLGMMYGMGKGKLASELGLGKEDTEDLFAKFHANVPFVKQLMEQATRKAEHVQGSYAPCSDVNVDLIYGNQEYLVFIKLYRYGKQRRNMAEI